MTHALLAHEKESTELAQKLVFLKNQIIENDAAEGLAKRFAAVKMGMLKHVPLFIKFEQEDKEFFMVLENREFK